MKNSKTPTDKQFASAARKMFEKEGHLEFDDEPVISRGVDDGAYVQAWVWVPEEEALTST